MNKNKKNIKLLLSGGHCIGRHTKHEQACIFCKIFILTKYITMETILRNDHGHEPTNMVGRNHQNDDVSIKYKCIINFLFRH